MTWWLFISYRGRAWFDFQEWLQDVIFVDHIHDIAWIRVIGYRRVGHKLLEFVRKTVRALCPPTLRSLRAGARK